MWGSPAESGASTKGYAVRRPSRPISRVLSPQPAVEARSSIWDDGYPPSLAAYPELKWDGPPRRSCLALLPMGDTWPPVSPRAPVVSYTTFSPLLRRLCRLSRLLFCGPFPPGSLRPRLGVTQHRALWSPDFPQPMRSIGCDRLANLGVDSMIAHDQWLSRVDPNRKHYSTGL
jgi:hypothetical protein